MKPIVITPEIKESLIAEFSAQIDGTKMFDGEFSFKKSFKWDGGDERASITFEPEAFMKMLTLVNGFTTEVGWNGIAYRTGEGADFIIRDILVYPQIVTGADVDTDEEKFAQWVVGLPDEVLSHLRMQGHSHVNFSTSPSSTDLRDQESTLRQVKADDFYIFIIWNKKMEHTIKIFDLKENTLYEDKDIDLKVGEHDMSAFLEDAKKMVESFSQKAPAKSNTVTGMASPGVGTKVSGGAAPAKPSKKKKKSGASAAPNYGIDDEDDYTGAYLYGRYAYGARDWDRYYGY